MCISSAWINEQAQRDAALQQGRKASDARKCQMNCDKNVALTVT
jgi:hypothetical protein